MSDTERPGVTLGCCGVRGWGGGGGGGFVRDKMRAKGLAVPGLAIR